MSRFKYLFIAVVAVIGLIGATPIDRGVQLPPITALAITVQQGEIVIDGYAEAQVRDRLLALVGTMWVMWLWAWPHFPR